MVGIISKVVLKGFIIDKSVRYLLGEMWVNDYIKL